jgi:hypothetical protein
VLGIHAILWSETQRSGTEVRRRLFAFLSHRRRRAPQRGRGAYLRRFIEHAQKVTRSYADGLFHCYDDSRIPQTGNGIENLNGLGKHNLRRCAGHGSTANGPGSSNGRMYMFAVALHQCLSEDEITELLAQVSHEDYRFTRKTLNEIREPATQRRSHLRNPKKHLAKILQAWLKPNLYD